MLRFRFFLCATTWLILAGGLSAPLHGQAVSGTILGSVHDGTGAVVPGASITVTSSDLGLNRSATSDASGEYTFPSLPPGTYVVTVQASGFKKTSLSSLQLGIDQKLRVDIALQIGGVNESVNVEGAAPVVKSDSSELGDTVTARQIADLPLNGRDFVNLTRIIPGVVRGIPGANIDGAAVLPGAPRPRFPPTANGPATTTSCSTAWITTRHG